MPPPQPPRRQPAPTEGTAPEVGRAGPRPTPRPSRSAGPGASKRAPAPTPARRGRSGATAPRDGSGNGNGSADRPADNVTEVTGTPKAKTTSTPRKSPGTKKAAPRKAAGAKKAAAPRKAAAKAAPARKAPAARPKAPADPSVAPAAEMPDAAAPAARTSGARIASPSAAERALASVAAALEAAAASDVMVEVLDVPAAEAVVDEVVDESVWAPSDELALDHTELAADVEQAAVDEAVPDVAPVVDEVVEIVQSPDVEAVIESSDVETVVLESDVLEPDVVEPDVLEPAVEPAVEVEIEEPVAEVVVVEVPVLDEPAPVVDEPVARVGDGSVQQLEAEAEPVARPVDVEALEARLRETGALRRARDARTPTAYLPGLDGLRAVAVVAVVLYHLGELPGGFLGVDVFFVVSGFLITRLLLAEREREGHISFRQFWLRRFKRLVPALLMTLTAVAILSKAWLPAWRLTDIRNDGLSALGYIANWRFIWSGQSYFTQGAAPSPLRHTWSLAIEEQFYLLWPLLVAGVLYLTRNGRQLAGRRAVAVVTLVGAVASATWMAVAAGSHDLSRIYFGTDTRIFAPLIGAWMATWFDPSVFGVADRFHHRVRSKRLARAAVWALLPLAALFALGANDSEIFYRFGFQLTAVISLVVVAGTATGKGVVGKVFGHPVLVWIGRRSYSIYLWSWPTQVYAQEYFRVDGLTLDAVVLAGAFGLASLSFWLIEEPVRRHTRPWGFDRTGAADRPSFRRITRPVRAVVAIAVVAGLIVAFAAGAPEPPSYLRTSNQEAIDAALAPGDGPDAVTLPPTTSQPKAPPGETTTTLPLPPGPLDKSLPMVVDPDASVDPSTVRGRPMKIMVAGDSVGWTLAWHLGKALTDSVQLEDRALIGCGLMPPDWSFIEGDSDPEQYGDQCKNADLAEARGLSKSPDAVLLVVGAWEVYDQMFDGKRYEVGEPAYRVKVEQRIQERIDRYRGIGAATIIPRVPCFARNASRLGAERHEQRRLKWVNARVEAVAARNPGWVRLIEPFDQLCDGPDDAKAETPTGLALRQDGAHFDPEAAVWFWNTWLAGQMGAAFENATTPWPPPTTTTVPPTTTVPVATTTPGSSTTQP